MKEQVKQETGPRSRIKSYEYEPGQQNNIGEYVRVRAYKRQSCQSFWILLWILPLSRKYAFQSCLTSQIFSVTNNLFLGSLLAKPKNATYPNLSTLQMGSQFWALSFPRATGQLKTEKARCLQATLSLRYYILLCI